MNEGYIITNNNTKVIVATDEAIGKRVLDYNSNIKEILINENLIQIIDDKMTACTDTGKLLYNSYQKYFKMAKINKKILLSLIFLFIISLIAGPILNISNMFFINAFFIASISITILGIPALRILKKQMKAEIEKNAFKMEVLDREKTKLLEKNSELERTSTKERVESHSSTVFEINHKKELEILNKEVLAEMNSVYDDTLKNPKRKIRTR